MSKIVYLLGAGASFGKRHDKYPEFEILGKPSETGDIKIIGKCAYIVEGLPLVVEIPGRLANVINEIQNCEISQNTQNTVFPLGSYYGGTGFSTAREMLIKELKWLKEGCENHATIDTFAKKLYLKKQYKDFCKVEYLLSIFFILEQAYNKKDGRYDTFLASILDENLEIDNRITILTWNYDCQFELAYKEYVERKNGDWIRNKLKIADLKDQTCLTRNRIFKLNGTANFTKYIDINDYNGINEELLVNILDAYINELNLKNTDSRISFAWDNAKYLETNFEDILEKAIKDAEILVVIGYTFPFFNREIDRKIFKAMNNLKKIYIQDPNAVQIKENLNPIYSISHTNVSHVDKNVSILTNTSQFFLPPEL